MLRHLPVIWRFGVQFPKFEHRHLKERKAYHTGYKILFDYLLPMKSGIIIPDAYTLMAASAQLA